MACFHPLKAYWSKKKHWHTGNRYLVFNPNEGYQDKPVYVKCGKCIGCRLAKSFEWAVRCTCESYFFRENYFLTLTYDRDHLPCDGNLNRLDVQLFLKRLRRRFPKHRIKVFYCGEYGDFRNRPHYHMILFGLPLAEYDIRMFKAGVSKKRNVNYSCPFIERIWGKGIVTVGTFSGQAASYVAQYTIKKCKKNSFCRKEVQPFIGMSLRTPIGYQFFDKHWMSLFVRGNFNLELGKKRVQLPVISFFKRQLKKKYPYHYWRYVERPKRLLEFKSDVLHQRMRIAMLNEKEILRLDKELQNRYYKEARLLRRLEARADL